MGKGATKGGHLIIAVICALIVCLSTLAQAQNERVAIFEGLCLDRAKELDFIQPEFLEPVSFDMLTSSAYGGLRKYRLEIIHHHLKQDFSQLQSEISNHQSELASYLKACSENKAFCSQHFSIQNKNYVRTYCDSLLYRQALDDAQISSSLRLNSCKEASQKNELSDFCFTGPRHETRIPEFEQRLRTIQIYSKKRSDLLLKALSAPYGDALAFVLGKLDEDMAAQITLRRFPEIDPRRQYSEFVTHLEENLKKELHSSLQKSAQKISQLSQSVSERFGQTFTPSQDGTIAYFKDASFKKYTPTWLTEQQSTIAVTNKASAAEVFIEKSIRSKIKELTLKDKKELLEGFAPYHAARVSKEWIIDRLDLLSSDQLQKAIESPDRFKTFYVNSICGSSSEFKSNPICHKDRLSFLEQAAQEVHDLLLRNIITFKHDSHERSSRFDEETVHQLNKILSSINHFCWESADPTSNPSEALIAQLQETMFPLFSTRAFLGLMTQSSFRSLIAFDPVKMNTHCFKRGYIFGARPSLSAAASMTDYISSSKKPKDKYIDPQINLSLQDIQKEELAARALLREELHFFKNIQEASFDIEAALADSIKSRSFSILDYAMTKPSRQMAEKVALLYQEYSSLFKKDDFWNQALLLGSIPVFIGAMILSGGNLAWIALTCITATIVDITTALAEIDKFKHHRKILDQASITGNIFPADALELQSEIESHISDRKLSIYLALAFMGVGDIFVGTKLAIRLLKDPAFRASYYWRKIMLDKMKRQQLNGWQYLADAEAEHFIASHPKVSKELMDHLITAFRKGEGKEFFERTFASDLPKVINPNLRLRNRIKNFIPNTVGKGARFVAKLPVIKPILNTVVPPMYMLTNRVLSAVDYLINRHLWKRIEMMWILTVARIGNSSFEIKQRLLKTANKAIERKALSATEIAFIEKKLGRDFVYDKTLGQLVWKISAELDEKANAFIARAVVTNNPTLRNEVIAMVKSNIMEPHEWDRLFRNFERTIASDEDRKDLLRIIKFFKQEHGIRSQMRRTLSGIMRIPESAFNQNLKELKTNYFGKFSKLTEEGLDNVNLFFDLAQELRAKSMLRFNEIVERYLKNENVDFSTLSNGMMDAAEYDLKALRENLPFYKAKMNADLVPKQTGWFEKKFIQEHIEADGHFFNIIENRLNGKAIGLLDRVKSLGRKRLLAKRTFEDAFFEAKWRTTYRKVLQQECRLPENSSVVRKQANKTFVNLAVGISAASEGTMFFMENGADYRYKNIIDVEWLSRLFFDLIMPQIGVFIGADAYTTSGLGYGAKHFKIAGSYFFVEMADATAYQLLNDHVFTRKEIIEDKINDLIKRDENWRQLETLFVKYPKLQGYVVSKLTEMKKDWDAVIQKMAQNGEVTPDGLYEEFLKRGMVQEFVNLNLSHNEQEQALWESVEDAIYYDHYNAIKRKDLNLPLGINVNMPEVFYKQVIQWRSRDWAPDWFDGSEGLDRMLYHYKYDLGLGTAFFFTRSHIAYRILCTGRHLPLQPRLIAAAMAFGGVKMFVDRYYFWERKQSTGR